MKKDVLSSWLRELCTLVFTQTLQAFLLAILMSMVVKALVSSTTFNADGTVNTINVGDIDASGIFCIVALLSLPKIELLIKNIFGITSGQGDPALANGKKSLTAGTLLAYRSAGRVLDNGKKLLGGAGRAFSGGIRKFKAEHDLLDYKAKNKDLDALPQEDISDGAETTTVAGMLTSGGGYTPAAGGQRNSDGTGAITRLANELAALNAAITNQNVATTALNAAITNQNVATTALNSSIKKQNMEAAKDKSDAKKADKLKELQAAIDSAKKDRNDGLKSMAYGIVESVGAAHGAVAGAVVGGAIGDEIPEATLKGMGAGDVIGHSAVDIVTSAPNVTNTVKMTYNEIQREVRNHDAYKKLREEIAEDNKKSFDEMQKKLDLYAKQNIKSDKDTRNSRSSANSSGIQNSTIRKAPIDKTISRGRSRTNNIDDIT